MSKDQGIERNRGKKTLELKKSKKLLKNKELKTESSVLEQSSSQKEEEQDTFQPSLKKIKSSEEPDKKGDSSVRERIKKKEKHSSVLDKELSFVKEKLKQALNDNLYLRAEFENFKKRSAEESNRFIRYEGERFISSLANEVLDDLDRAMSFAQEEKSFENLKKGFDLIQKKLSQLFSHFGVEILDPAGKAFDPSYQEALSHIKTSKVPEGYVAETVRKAYKLHGKVIRPAQVILAKKDN